MGGCLSCPCFWPQTQQLFPGQRALVQQPHSPPTQGAGKGNLLAGSPGFLIISKGDEGLSEAGESAAQEGRGGQQGLACGWEGPQTTGLAVSLGQPPRAMATGWAPLELGTGLDLSRGPSGRGQPGADVSAPFLAQPSEGSRTQASGCMPPTPSRGPGHSLGEGPAALTLPWLLSGSTHKSNNVTCL